MTVPPMPAKTSCQRIPINPARLPSAASGRSQVIVVSHADPLVAALSGKEGSVVFALDKELGETVAPGIDPPAWAWPSR
jgi:predicted ATPase